MPRGQSRREKRRERINLSEMIVIEMYEQEIYYKDIPIKMGLEEISVQIADDKQINVRLRLVTEDYAPILQGRKVYHISEEQGVKYVNPTVRTYERILKRTDKELEISNFDNPQHKQYVRTIRDKVKAYLDQFPRP